MSYRLLVHTCKGDDKGPYTVYSWQQNGKAWRVIVYANGTVERTEDYWPPRYDQRSCIFRADLLPTYHNE
jgi:hypothetical protein